MNCKRAQKMLADYVNEVLGAEDSHRVQQHIAGCENCRREQDILRKVFRIIDDVEVEYPPTSVWQNFLPDLHRRIENEAALLFKKQQRRHLYLLPGWAATAAVILVLFASLMLRDYTPIRATRVGGMDKVQLKGGPSAAKDFTLVADAISKALITEAEAEKLRELRSASQTETQIFPYYLPHDDSDVLIDSGRDTDAKQGNEDVIKYLEEKFGELDGGLMIESDDSELGAI